MKMRRNRRGLTIVEVIVALLVMTVGILAIMSTTAFATRTMTRGRMADMAATFAARRMELLRGTVCANAANGGYSVATGSINGQLIKADTLQRSGTNVVINSWTITNAGNSTWSIMLTTTYTAELATQRTAISETEVPCIQ